MLMNALVTRLALERAESAIHQKMRAARRAKKKTPCLLPQKKK
jgi:hypothetical protein